ncbi:MAG: hypothetical protein PWQ77_1289 [Kosmotogales bacterium]|nr:hypothetical protein [Kosmotogales bacterium]
MSNQKIFVISAELDDEGKICNTEEFAEHFEQELKEEWEVKSHSTVLYGNRLVNTFVASRIKHVRNTKEKEDEMGKSHENPKVSEEEANEKVLKRMGIIE